MSARAKELGIALLSGILFGAGLVVSGMTQPQKVIGFLDLFGAWDLSLAFVMVGAIGVHLVAYRFIRGRRSPFFGSAWSLPTRRDIDLKLIVGAALFGVGWGIAGYCPGPSITSLATGARSVLVFVAAMLIGMWLAARLERPAVKPAAPARDPEHPAASAS
jgi:uncharacterized membrane protein YedE/YeeE